jgi:predicted ABC-type transport system involved in lysophospholipase L1 biosynthesis ATPase subunit
MGPGLEPAVDARAGAEGTRLDLDGVCRWFAVGDTVVKAVDDINLHVDEAAFVVVLGPSGSGKTTLLNLIGALDAPTAGTIRLNGQDLTTASRAQRMMIRRHTVSFVFQSFNLFPGLTALENVQFGADVAGRAGAAEVAWEVLGQVGLAFRRPISPISCPAGSSSGWPSPGPWLPVTRSCWPTSPPGSWTSAPGYRSWNCSGRRRREARPCWW